LCWILTLGQVAVRRIECRILNCENGLRGSRRWLRRITQPELFYAAKIVHQPGFHCFIGAIIRSPPVESITKFILTAWKEPSKKSPAQPAAKGQHGQTKQLPGASFPPRFLETAQHFC